MIGDVHGCSIELTALLERAGFDPERHLGILSGDLYTRGPDPLGVQALVDRLGLDCVGGNHEMHLLKRLPQIRNGELALEALPPSTRAIASAFTGAALDRLITELRAMPLWIDGELSSGRRWIVVHAGVDPNLGFTPNADAKIFTNIRFWPPAPKEQVKTHWHDFYRGEELLIFGHDAIGGLVEIRDPAGRPRAVGLDTGCVYGGRLTGYWIERDRFVSVPARRRWWSLRPE